jgi:hypothetical protein
MLIYHTSHLAEVVFSMFYYSYYPIEQMRYTFVLPYQSVLPEVEIENDFKWVKIRVASKHCVEYS